MSVSLAAVVYGGHYDLAGLIEAEKDAPLPYAEAIPAFQCTLQRLDVAPTACSGSFQSGNDTFRLRAVDVSEFALGGRLIVQKAGSQT